MEENTEKIPELEVKPINKKKILVSGVSFLSAKQKRKALIHFTIREHRLNRSLSEHATYTEILYWQKIDKEKVDAWYNKFFSTEDKIVKSEKLAKSKVVSSQ